MKGVLIPIPPRINNDIRASQIHLIDSTGKSLGTVAIGQALWLAWEEGLDLVEVGPNANPPVVRLLDYGKYQYEQAKAESKSRAHAPDIKEVRLSLTIGNHDFEVKRRQADAWLAEGDRVRITVTLYGREAAFPERAREMIEKTRQALSANYDTGVAAAGRRYNAIVSRKKE